MSSFPLPSGPKKVQRLKAMLVISLVLHFITRRQGSKEAMDDEPEDLGPEFGWSPDLSRLLFPHL